MNNFRNSAFFALSALLAVLSACSPAPQQENYPAISTSVPIPLMPNVVCMNLQDAQDKIQEQGVFFSQSIDASGLNRRQIIDRNWIVVKQNISPGKTFSERDAVLSVLKEGDVQIDEICPDRSSEN